MEFKRLKASIAHNQGEKPTIYMAVCAIESLVYDIEDEADSELSACPVGDETLPTKLAWLCNTVLDIYNDNRDEMTRSRERLDRSVEKLKAVDGQLKELSDVSEELAKVKRKLDDRTEALEELQDSKRRYDELQEKCRAAEKKLGELKAFDVDEARKRLTDLESRVAEQERAKGEQAELLRIAEEELKTAEAALAEVASKRESVIEKVSEIRRAEANENAELKKKQQQYETLMGSIAGAKNHADEAEARLKELTEQLGKLQDRTFAIEKQAIPEKETGIKEENERLSALEAELTALDSQRRELTEKTEKLEADKAKTAEALQLSRTEYDNLTADYTAQSGELQDLKKKLADMKTETDAQKYALYKQQLEDSIAEAEKLSRDCAKAERELLEKQAQIREMQSLYDDKMNKKLGFEESEKKLSARLAELEPIATQEFTAKAIKMGQELQQLSSARNELCDAVSQIGEILGEPTVADNKEVLNRMGNTMERLQKTVMALQSGLLKCAKAIKLEER